MFRKDTRLKKLSNSNYGEEYTVSVFNAEFKRTRLQLRSRCLLNVTQYLMHARPRASFFFLYINVYRCRSPRPYYNALSSGSNLVCLSRKRVKIC